MLKVIAEHGPLTTAEVAERTRLDHWVVVACVMLDAAKLRPEIDPGVVLPLGGGRVAVPTGLVRWRLLDA